MPWLWPGRISLGGVTVLDSAYGSAMRLVAIDLAARVSTGRAMPDGASGLATAADVVVATHRGSSHTVLAGLEAAGADVSRVTHMACEVEDLLSETDLEALSSSIPDGTQLVVIDPGVCPAVASFPTPKGGCRRPRRPGVDATGDPGACICPNSVDHWVPKRGRPVPIPGRKQRPHRAGNPGIVVVETERFALRHVRCFSGTPQRRAGRHRPGRSRPLRVDFPRFRRNGRRVNPHEVFIADAIDRGPGCLLEERCE